MIRMGVVTGTRAEYGLLRPVIERVQRAGDMELRLIVTGMHLEAAFGDTYQEIERDGHPIAHKIPMHLTSDQPDGIVRSMGQELTGFADVFAGDPLDILVVLGDRYEIMPAVLAATMFQIPIAHIHGGELTEGMIDEAVRHAVTKMSDLHFTSTETYRRRVIQMGEQPSRVFCVGALGVENIQRVSRLDRETLCKTFGAHFAHPFVMVTYHPVTLEHHTAEAQFRNLLAVIERHPEYRYIFTYANADADGAVINRMIERYVAAHPEQAMAVVSMGMVGYLSALSYTTMVLGNSSSGIIEAPSFHIPTVNIGNRQLGRVRATSVIDCGYREDEIETAFAQAISPAFRALCRDVKNPYEGTETSATIVSKIREFLQTYHGAQKYFYDIDFPLSCEDGKHEGKTL